MVTTLPTLAHDLFGNTAGLKSSAAKKLHATYRRRLSASELVSPELARHLTECSREIGRQVGVLLTRSGEIEAVIVGDSAKLVLPDIGRARAGQVRLRGLRLVHTHLKHEPLTRDDLTDLALLRLDLVAAIDVEENGLPGKVSYATLLPQSENGELWRIDEVPSVHELDYDPRAGAAELESEFARQDRTRKVGRSGRALLVGIAGQGEREHAESSLVELRELARTAGVEIAEAVLQARAKPDPNFLVGKGKLDEIVMKSLQLGADVLIFDHNLSPSQSRHIGEVTSLKIIDRTQLILDIFAQRAQSADGKLQVELAQLRYLLPRLGTRDDALSRLSGGIGGRGPGETKLEMDRRRVRDRIAFLEEKVAELVSGRIVRRKQRNKGGVPIISIVGYTNAGKSTLLNALTDSDVLVEDKLFATLDPTSRRLRFPQEREVILTDTVGFIRDLPKDLVAAFRATLEELTDADLLLHVIDASDPAHEDQARAVETILGELGLSESRRLRVYNKSDRLSIGEAAHFAEAHGGIAVSAKNRTGFATLLGKCEEILWREGVVRAPGPDEAEFLRTVPEA